MKLPGSVDNVLQSVQKPSVNPGELMNPFHRISLEKSLGYGKDALVGRLLQRMLKLRDIALIVADKSMHPLPYHSQAFLYRLFECTTYCHNFANRLHRRAYLAAHTMELTEIPSGYLANYIVKSRLKECRSLLCDRILKVKQSITQSQLGCHKSKRIACSFRCQSRRSAQTRIHLYNPIVKRIRVKSILHITLAHDSNMAHYLYGKLAQPVIILVGESLGRGDHNRLPCVDSERVKVLHIAYGDAIVKAVTHHFILHFFPSFQ